jgi:hypothetical protein
MTAVAMTPNTLYEYEMKMTEMLEIPDSVRAVIAGMEACLLYTSPSPRDV